MALLADVTANLRFVAAGQVSRLTSYQNGNKFKTTSVIDICPGNMAGNSTMRVNSDGGGQKNPGNIQGIWRQSHCSHSLPPPPTKVIFLVPLQPQISNTILNYVFQFPTAFWKTQTRQVLGARARSFSVVLGSGIVI